MATQSFQILSAKTYRQNQSPFVSGIVDPHPYVPSTGYVLIRQESTTFTDPTTQIMLTVRESFDGGTTWRVAATSGWVQGGQISAKTGQPVLDQLGVSLPDLSDPQYANYRLEGQMDIIGSITMSLWLDLTTP